MVSVHQAHLQLLPLGAPLCCASLVLLLELLPPFLQIHIDISMSADLALQAAIDHAS